MGMSINWGQVLGQVISEIIQVLAPWLKEELPKIIDWAYNQIEEWARRFREDIKPTSAEKMAKAVGLVQVMEPKITGPEARVMLELKHLEVTGGKK